MKINWSNGILWRWNSVLGEFHLSIFKLCADLWTVNILLLTINCFVQAVHSRAQEFIMMKMSLLQPTLVAFLAFLIHNVNVEADQSKCYPGSTFIQGSSVNYCLYMANVTLGPMNFTEAKNQCSAPFPSYAGYVVWTRERVRC